VLTSLAGVLAPLAAEAQQAGRIARLGLLGLLTSELGARSVAAVREGLAELGWHEGQNIHFTYRYASRKRDQLAALAAGLVQQKVDIIVAFGTDSTRAARPQRRVFRS
jgi:putative tryptophan/tyrosine transport system substrate-binding protein